MIHGPIGIGIAMMLVGFMTGTNNKDVGPVLEELLSDLLLIPGIGGSLLQ